LLQRTFEQVLREAKKIARRLATRYCFPQYRKLPENNLQKPRYNPKKLPGTET
jgi:hypothetical protein